LPTVVTQGIEGTDDLAEATNRMKLPPFAVHRPRSVLEASRLLVDLGDDASAYCGGTELLLAMKLGLADYAHLVDLKRVDSLRAVERRADCLRIGAAATHHELETSPMLRAWCPEMAAMLSQVANLRVRSVGTLGGNLCFADPHSDPLTFLIAAGASMLCQKGEDSRHIPAAEFLTGPYQSAMRQGEILVAVDVPARRGATGFAHVRMKLHERPAVAVAAMIRLSQDAVSEARLVVGSVGSVPVSAEAGGFLVGAREGDFDARADDSAWQTAQASDPMPDGECSPEYLRHLVRVHSRRALTAAYSAARDHRRDPHG
jgi:carbon-monoxide dehydrogenase medium subunit